METQHIIEIVVATILMTAIIYGIVSEYRDWNKGICKQTGEPWELFDRSSQGCRGYKSGEYRIWVSWPVDRKRKQK